MANSERIALVDAVAEEELDVAVPELEIPDESRRVPVPCRKDGHLENLARLHRGLVDALARQDRYGGSGQNPICYFPILVRDGELDARVRIGEIQLLELSNEDHLFVQVVDTRHCMMGLQRDAGYNKA